MGQGKAAVNEDRLVLELATLCARTVNMLRRHSWLTHINWARVCELHEQEQKDHADRLLCKRSILKRQITAVLNPTARTSFNDHYSPGSRQHVEKIEREVRKRGQAA